MQQKTGTAGRRDPGADRARGVWPALLIMIGTHVPVIVASMALPAVAPLAAGSLGLPARYVGLYTATIFAVALATMYLAPGLVARFGPVRTSQGTLVLAAAGLVALSGGTAAFAFLSAVLIGCAYAPATPASSRLLSGLTTEGRRSGIFSIKQTSVPAGGALAGLLTPALALMFGWQGAALALALLCLVIAAAAEPWRASFDRERLPGRAILNGNPLTPALTVMHDPRLRPLGLMAVVYAGAQFTLASVLVTFLVERGGLATVEAAAILSVALTVSVFARIAWGYATLLVAPRLVLALLGLLTAGVYVAALYMAPSWPRAGLLAFGCWFGAVAYSWNGIFLAETADRSGGRVAEATAGAVSLAFLGALIVPVLFTGLIAFLDFEAGLMAVAALMLAAAIYAGAALRR